MSKQQTRYITHRCPPGVETPGIYAPLCAAPDEAGFLKALEDDLIEMWVEAGKGKADIRPGSWRSGE